MLLKACINGARPADSHPALPTTPAAAAAAASAAVAAGAGAVHVHVRGADKKESLAGADVAAIMSAVRAAIPGTPVGISTGAWIVPNVVERMTLVRTWTDLPDFASVNVHEEGSAELARLLMERGVGVESGVWGADDAEALAASGIAGDLLRILIEPRGATPAEALATTTAIESVLDAAGIAAPRLLHGNRDTTWALVRAAAERGYDTRIGLEDCLTLPGGETAADNAALVTAALAEIDAVRAGGE